MSLIRQNFHEECEKAINEQANQELRSSYFYLALAYHFDRDDVALGNFKKYFSKLSEKKQSNAAKFLQYINDRGGKVVFKDITTPENNFGEPAEVMKAALAHEKMVNDKLIKLTNLSEKHHDEHLADFLEDHFLQPQVDALKEISGHMKNLERAGPGLGVYMFDHETLGEDH
eukprot:gene326-958_t